VSQATKKARGPRRINGELLDVAGASQFLGLPVRGIYGRVARKALPHRKLNGRVVFLRSELSQFIQSLPGLTLEELREAKS
jgi:predicted DNA-binding transcriptional regulator AlpA